jgi:hypothetical protein
MSWKQKGTFLASKALDLFKDIVAAMANACRTRGTKATGRYWSGER